MPRYTRDEVATWRRHAREDRERDPEAYARMLAEVAAQARRRADEEGDDD